MNKTLSSLRFILYIFLITLHASVKDKPSPYEEIYPEIGYISVEGAMDDFEQHFK